MPDLIWDSYGRAWTAEQFAATDAAKMLNIDAFVDVLRLHYEIEDPDRLLHLMAIRDEPSRAYPEGYDIGRDQ